MNVCDALIIGGAQHGSGRDDIFGISIAYGLQGSELALESGVAVDEPCYLNVNTLVGTGADKVKYEFYFLYATKTKRIRVLLCTENKIDAFAWYAASDCFILPSYREGFPNTVLEAGAMGLPCIVTDINGSREIVEDGKNGIVIPSMDTDALFNAMKRMMEEGRMRRSMAEKARVLIASRFEKGFVQKCLLDFYEEIFRSDRS